MDAATPLAGVRAGREAHPDRRRGRSEGLLVEHERVVRSIDVRLADARVVVQVVAEVDVAVAHVGHAVEHVHVPDHVDVRGSRDLALGERLAELEEAPVRGLDLLDLRLGPVRMIALDPVDHPGQVDVGHVCQDM